MSSKLSIPRRPIEECETYDYYGEHFLMQATWELGVLEHALNEAGFQKCLVRAIFSNCPNSACRDSKRHGLSKLWYKNALLLEIWLSPYLSAWIKLRRSGAV